MLNDPHSINKVSNILEKLVMSYEVKEPIFAPLLEGNTCKVGNKIRHGKKFMLSLVLGGI